MAIMAKSEGDFKQPAVGSWPARCIAVIELGHQPGEYKGVPNVKHQALVIWELPTQDLMDDGRPMSISKFYTLSLSDKANLTKDLQSWRGKAFTEQEKLGFDISTLIGVPCMLSIIEKNEKSRVDAVMGLPKGTPIPDQMSESTIFELEAYINGDDSVWNKLSEGVQKMIKRANEFNPETIEHSMAQNPKGGQQAASGVPPVPDDFDDDIPF
jgi:hypothetical protein